MMNQQMQEQLRTLAQCAEMCNHCVYNVCLGDPNMKDCGQLCLDCAQICNITAAFVGRNSRFSDPLVNVCADICDRCAAECEKFPNNTDMQQCAKICRQCAETCRSMVGQMARA